MIIALPSRNDAIDDHFGHCDYFTLVEVENGAVTSKKRFESPQGCGCKSGVAPLLAEAGVKLMLAGNMGQGAVNVLASNGIEVVRGCSGSIDDTIAKYLKGELTDNQEVCDHHDCSH